MRLVPEDEEEVELLEVGAFVVVDAAAVYIRVGTFIVMRAKHRHIYIYIHVCLCMYV